jgi:PAS domain S-box-containing protein
MMSSLRLFLIEDEDPVALMIRRELERAEHHVTRCRTAADALIVLGQNTFDLVLLDQRLPDMTGLDLLHTLTRDGIAAPVLMITAFGDANLAARVMRAGALDYVVKDHKMSFLQELPKRVQESVTRYQLEQMNNLLIEALESARDGIMITDLEGTILKVNQALVNMTGYERQELVGQKPWPEKSNVHPPELFASLWRTISQRFHWQGELTNRRKDGSLFQASLTVSPIVDSRGRLTHFVGIQRDITEQKQLERQLLQAQKMHSVGTLAGGVAHEFNNLLAGINGYASLGLREAGLTPTLREFLQHVVSLSERAAILTRQLLAFARKPALSRQRTLIPDLLQATAELVRRTLHQEVILEMQTLAHDGGPLLVEADANQLQQALINLALNARDAIRTQKEEIGRIKEEKGESLGPVHPSSLLLQPSEDAITFRLGHVVLTSERVGFPQKVPPGDYVVLEVADRGCGMTTEVFNQALDPFFTTKEVGQGTGLGLPMVFGIVQGHHGFLNMDSQPGQGTRMSLYLPRHIDLPGDEMRSDLHLHSEVLEPDTIPGYTILVIDDEEAVLDVVRRFLQIAGHRVVCATTGTEAVDLLATGRAVDLVILDLMMPREDTSETFQRLRQRRPALPILLCTGLPQADASVELLRYPGVSLLRKPFRMGELWSAVKQALAGEPPRT